MDSSLQKNEHNCETGMSVFEVEIDCMLLETSMKVDQGMRTSVLCPLKRKMPQCKEPQRRSS
jgi:hypothetical protein